MIFSLSTHEKEARENRGSSCRPSFVVVVRPSGVGKMRDVEMVFHFERVSLRLYPLALENEEGKKKETRWIAVINQTKRRRRG
jgi:hypothetical protein